MIFIMSGQPYKYHTDAQRFRDEYMEALNLRASIDDMNHQAVKTFVATGQLPAVSQMKDTRTTTEILADTEKLKINLISDLSPIADAQFAQLIIQTIVKSPLNYDNGLLVFLSQRVDDIVKNLQQIYKYKIKGDANDAEQFVAFINKMYMDKNALSKSTKGFINRSGSVGSFGSYSSDLPGIKNAFHIFLQEIGFIYKNVSFRIPRGHVMVDTTLLDSVVNIIQYINSQFKLYTSIIPHDLDKLKEIDKMVEMMNEHKISFTNREFGFYQKYLTFLNERLPKIDILQNLLQKLKSQSSIFKDNVEHQVNDDGSINIPIQTGQDSLLNKIYNLCISLSGVMSSEDELIDINETFKNILSHIQEQIPEFRFGDEGGEEEQKEGDEDPPLMFGNISPPSSVVSQPSIQSQREYESDSASSVSSEDRRISAELIELKHRIDELVDQHRGMAPSRNRRYLEDVINQYIRRFEDESYINYVRDVEPLLVHNHVPYARAGPPQVNIPVIAGPQQAIAPVIDEKLAAHTELSRKFRDADYRDTIGLLTDDDIDQINVMVDAYRQRFGEAFSINHPPQPVIQGRGIGRKIRGRGLQVDHSIGVKPAIKFAQFGKYLLDMSKLKDDTIAMKTMSGTSVVGHPSKKVSTQFSKIVKDMIGGKVPSDEDLSGLSNLEREYLHKVSKKANIEDKFAVATPSKDQYEKDIHSFEVMRGEIVAGNDNQEMIKKFKLLIMKLSRSGSLPKNEVSEILSELAELGY